MKVFIVGDTGLLDGLALWSMADPGDVLLYVAKDVIPEATHDELLRLANRIDEIVVVGGTARVSMNVQSQLGLLYDAPTLRVAGPSRFATAAAISQESHPVEPPPDSTVLWSADVETGDLSQFLGVSTSGNGTAVASTEKPHADSYSTKLTAVGLAGIRLRTKENLYPDPENLPNDSYYSAWYYIPFTEMRDNIFQFKYADIDYPGHQTRRMLTKASLNWDYTDLSYGFTYNTRIRQDSGMWIDGETDILASYDAGLPINQWFHLEMRYVWGQDGTGRSTLWVDGVEGWDLQNISTEPNNCTYIQEPRQFTVNHYLSDYENDNNRTTWIFVDDAKIATGRIGP